MFNKLTIYLIAAIIALAAILAVLVSWNQSLRTDRNRIASNFDQVTYTNAVLNLSIHEFETMQTADKFKLDSVIAANKIRPRTIKAATVINTVYQDTGSVQVIYRPVEVLPDSSYTIAVSYSDQCWGVEGNIHTTDRAATLELTRRTSANSAQLIVTRRRVLGFLWWRKGEKYTAYSDCGTIEFTQINFVK